MAYTPNPTPRQNGGTLSHTPYLGTEERQLLERGKAEHRSTTATAKRALQVGGRGGGAGGGGWRQSAARALQLLTSGASSAEAGWRPLAGGGED
jgi:hypothetical protein